MDTVRPSGPDSPPDCRKVADTQPLALPTYTPSRNSMCKK